MRFEARELKVGARSEWGVYAVAPEHGNDSALLAVFELREPAERLVDLFTSVLYLSRQG